MCFCFYIIVINQLQKNQIPVYHRQNFSGKRIIPAKIDSVVFECKKIKDTNKSENILSKIFSFFSGTAPNKESLITPKGYSSKITKREYVSTGEVGKKIKKEYVSGGDYAKIKPEYNPDTLKITGNIKECYFADNISSPGGSIAITSRFHETIGTDGLWQCAAVAFTDKKHNLQTLLHFAPGVHETDNRACLEYILSSYSPENSEITVIPGKFKETGNTVAYLTDIIGKTSDRYKINYMNFPDERHSFVVLKNGKLTCSEGGNDIIRHTNPENMTVWAHHKFI